MFFLTYYFQSEHQLQQVWQFDQSSSGAGKKNSAYVEDGGDYE